MDKAFDFCIQTVRYLATAVVCIYIILIVLLNIPMVQSVSTGIISSALSSKIDSKVEIGRVDMGLLNRVIISDLNAWDQQGKKMLSAKRVSAKINVWELLTSGKVSIATAQLFDFKANLYKNAKNGPTNFQYVIDAFSSKDKTKKSNLNLRINSLIIRRGEVAYNEVYEPVTFGKFNAHHINVRDFSTYISLKALNKDSLNVYVRNMELKEASGFDLKNLTARVLANRKHTTIDKFEVVTANSAIKLKDISVDYAGTDSKDILKNIQYSGKITGTEVVAKDFCYFIPALQFADEKMFIDGNFKGTGNYVEVNGLDVRNATRDIDVRADVTATNLQNSNDMKVFARVRNLSVSGSGARTIVANIKGKDAQLPEIAERIGGVKFSGTAQYQKSESFVDGKIETDIGSALVKGSLKNSKNFEGYVLSDEINLGKLLNNDKLDKTSVDVTVKGSIADNKQINANITGDIDYFDYNNYRYQNIALNADVNGDDIDGSIKVDDRNVQLKAEGTAKNLKGKPDINAQVLVEKIRPYDLNLTSDYRNTEFSFEMDGRTHGSIKDLQGDIELNKFHMGGEKGNYTLDNFSIRAGKSDNSEKVIDVKSDFFDAHLNGNIDYATLPVSIKNVMHHYLPTLFAYTPNRNNRNAFAFDMKIKNAEPVEKLLGINLIVNKQGQIEGELDEQEEYVSVHGYLPQFEFNGQKIAQAKIACNNNGDELLLNVSMSKIGKSSIVDLDLNSVASGDKISTKLNWGNNLAVNYSGMLDVTTTFKKHQDGVETHLNINPTDIIIADSVWKMKKSDIIFSGKRIKVEDFMLAHSDQHLGINGMVSDNPADSLIADLKDIDIEYILDCVNFTAVDFGGKATGKIYASNLKKQPKADAQLFVQDFVFNTANMGNMDLYAKWDNEAKGIYLDGKMHELGISMTNVSGYIYPGKSALDLWVDASQTSMAMLNKFVGGVFENIRGRGNGNIHLHGPFNELNLEGDVCANVKAKVKVLNTEYEVKNDTIHLLHNYMDFSGITIYDKYGHKGSVNGYVKHQNLRNMTYMFDVSATGLLAYDEKKFGDMPFYGTIFGNGSVKISGGNNTLTTDVHMSPAPNTTFVYNAGRADDITSNQFITFVDKTPQEITWIPTIKQPEKEEVTIVNKPAADEVPMDLRINMLLDINENATMKIIMDPVSGDYIACNGNGPLKASYYNKGGFNMFGTLTMDHGTYKLSMQEVIRKDFNIRKGGTVVFSGNPYNADLNLQCVYTVNSASLSELEANAGNNRQSTVKVNCLMNLTGKMMKPDIKFDLEMPTISDEERQLVKSLISTDEQMNMQIIYLLGVGRFYTFDYANADATTNRSSSAVNSLLSSTISGQLNQMLGNVLSSNNWSVGTNLSTGNNGWSDMEVEGILSGRLLNNRLLFNGNFGYRDNPLANTNFVGDFDLQWLLTPSGEISLKGYSQTNDRYFTKATLTTQGVGIIFTKEFNNWKHFFRIHSSK